MYEDLFDKISVLRSIEFTIVNLKHFFIIMLYFRINNLHFCLLLLLFRKNRCLQLNNERISGSRFN